MGVTTDLQYAASNRCNGASEQGMEVFAPMTKQDHVTA
jgi:hypothetical protein